MCRNKGVAGQGARIMAKGRPRKGIGAVRKGRISIAISPELLRSIDRLARVEGRSRSDVMERLLRGVVMQEEVAVKAMSDPHVGRALIRTFSDPEVMQALAKAVSADLDDKQLRLFAERAERLASEMSGGGKGGKP